MIRKIVNSVLIFILMIPTLGITYHYHYCCDTLIEFSILHTPKPCCEHPEQCCHNETVTLQMKGDYVFHADMTDIQAISMELPISYTQVEAPRVLDRNIPVRPEESPPPDTGSRLSFLQRYLI